MASLPFIIFLNLPKAFVFSDSLMGRNHCFVGLVTRVTERMCMNKALQVRQKLFRARFDFLQCTRLSMLPSVLL